MRYTDGYMWIECDFTSLALHVAIPEGWAFW